jgi:hypothetical protein
MNSIAVYTARTLTAAAEPEYTGAIAINVSTLGSNSVALHVKLTNSASIQNKARVVRISYGFSTTDLSSTPASMKSGVKTLVLAAPVDANEVRVFTEDVAIKGPFFHVWLQHDEFSATQTLDITAIEADAQTGTSSAVPNGTSQRLGVSTSSIQFAAFPSGTSIVWWDVQSQDVFVTIDGSTPSSSNGHRLLAGDSGIWSKATAEAARFIRAGSSDGIVQGSPMK